MPGVGLNPTRIAAFEALRSCGADISIEEAQEKGVEPIGTIRVRAATLSGAMTLSGDAIPLLIDEVPILAVTALLGGCDFSVSDAAELRGKESDRITLLVKNLRALGFDVDERPDGFASRPKNGLFGARIETAHDHRIAMSFGIASLVVPGISIDAPECADVSFPGFWNILARLQRT
jgi:3-phosphoshikimate 1-carboxyvinyltransferase